MISIKRQAAAVALLTIFASTAVMPGAVFAQSKAANQQKNKNQWRNLGIAGAAVAGYGLLKHNTAATVLGAAGAAYSANRYEQDRKNQSKSSAARQRYHRTGSYTSNGRKYYTYNGNQYYMNLKTGARHKVD